MNHKAHPFLQAIMEDTDKSLLDKQEEIWELSGGISIEDMVAMKLVDPSDTESMLDLILNEIRLREPHSLQSLGFIEREYLHRFSHLKVPLQTLFECERQMLFQEDQRLESDPNASFEKNALSIPGYRIASEHARGGGGIIYKAIQSSLGREVAIKVFRSENQTGADSFQSLKDEAYKISKLFHRNIVQIFELGECDAGFYIVLPFIEGGSLMQNQDRLQGKLIEITSILRDVGLAVQYAHDVGILHCDITPNNILLAEGDRPLLTDFGLSKDSEDLDGLRAIDGFLKNTTVSANTFSPSTETKKTLGGTIGFMAPEQYVGDSHLLSERTDIYGLGAVLFFLLTGNTIPNPLSITDDAIRNKFGKECPKDLQEICMKCLSMKPYERYDSAALFCDDLSRFQSGRIVKARPLDGINNLPERVSKWSKRYPTSAILMFFTAVSTIVFVSALLITNRLLSKRTTDLKETLKLSAINSFNLGQLAASSGPVAQSTEAYQKTIDVLESYLVLHPKATQPKLLLAKTKNNLAISFSKENKVDLSIKTLKQAIKTMEANLPDSEKKMEWNIELANFHANLGNQYIMKLDLDNASVHFQKAQSIRQSCIYRTSIEKQFDIAKSHFDLGNLHRLKTNGTRQAIAKFKEAILILENIYSTTPDTRAASERLTQCYINLCTCLQREGRTSEIESMLTEAIQRWEAETRGDQGNNDKLKILAILLHNLGLNRSVSSNYKDAYKYLLDAEKILLSVVSEEGYGNSASIALGNCLATLSHTTRFLGVAEIDPAKRRGLFQESSDYADKAINLLKMLIVIEKPTAELLNAYYEALHARGILYCEINQLEDAIAIFGKILEDTSKSALVYEGLKMHRIKNYNALGRTVFDYSGGSLEQAVSAFQGGIAECQELTQSPTASLESLNYLLALHNGLGQTYMRLGDQRKIGVEKKAFYEKGLISLNQAVGLIDTLTREGGIQAPNLETYLSNYFLRAVILDFLEKYDLAKEDMQLFIRNIHPDDMVAPVAKSYYAVILAKLNRIQDAYNEIKPFVSEYTENIRVQYCAALCLAQIYGKLDSAAIYEQKDLMDRNYFLTVSIQCLERAKKGGYFQDALALAELRHDKAWDCIRSTNEFQTFLRSVEQPL
jgi:serine/threonine protein kinase